MYKQQHQQPNHLKLLLVLFSVLLSSFFNVSIAREEAKAAGKETKTTTQGEKKNPFTAKASLIRYWNRQISNNLPKPTFLISKASPLSAVESSFLTKLADSNTLSTHLPTFCSSANLICFSESSSSPSLAKHSGDVNFASYSDKNFTNYGTSHLGGFDSFKNYSDGENVVADSFRRYSRNSAGHDDKFANYAPDVNVHDGSFNTYGAGATGGAGAFKNYDPNANVPNERFTSYEDNGNGRDQSFTAYSVNGNAGDQSFTSYAKNANGINSEFSTYGKDTNVLTSTFSNYGENGNAANDTFTSYAFNTNNPQNNFRNYGNAGNAATESFSSYRDQANVGDDSFTSYAKNSNFAKVKFANYGKSFNEGTDKFSGYGKGSPTTESIGFKIYGVNNTFADYADKKGTSFARYAKRSSSSATAALMADGKVVNRWVEPGKFFRESMLKEGTVMPFPDIRDKMPKRSFLPRSLSSKLPFSSSKITELKQIFHAAENSSMEKILKDTLSECERVPSQGETKTCVGSIEDMIDFAVSVLGHNVVVRSTEGVKGSKENVMVGAVKGINGGKVTKSVSCHQSLYPYMVYYCHSVPKVRVYEAEILDVKSKQKINHGVAICHVDTSAWSAGHGAFVALGSRPGQIEVCHWIFENDMTWATADN